MVDAISNFNLKIKTGLQRFVEMDIYTGEEDPKPLGDFIFKYKEKFSKEKVGELFGDESPFNTKVCRAYINNFNFEGMLISDALRYLFTFFDVPGEGQKIERIVYEFAYKWEEDNPGIIGGDAAGVFSYLLVMLHSTLYNPNVEQKNKPSVDTFCSMAAPIKDNGANLNQELVKKVYQNIANKPLAVHWAQKRKDFLKEALTANIKKKEELCRVESTKIMEEIESKFESQVEREERRKSLKLDSQEDETGYTHFTNINFLKPFLGTMWKELFAFFSIIIENLPEDSDFKEVVNCAISMMKLADSFEMDEERDAFIIVFLQFSGLDLIANRYLHPYRLESSPSRISSSSALSSTSESTTPSTSTKAGK